MNAKEELLEDLRDFMKVKCACIGHEYFNDADDKVEDEIILKVGYSESEFEEFLNKLDFDYDDMEGPQYVWGIVWLEDGTWLARNHHDGLEWWTHVVSPAIPKICQRQTTIQF